MQKHRLAVVTLAVALGTLPAPLRAARTEDEADMRTHRLRTLDGEDTTLSAWRGEVLVVNFWASWCKPCLKELPIMNEWQESWSGRGARVVAISVDHDSREARRFVEKSGLSVQVLHDGTDGLAHALDLPSLPRTYVLDREGRIVTEVQGSTKADLAALHQSVETLLAGGAR